MKKLTKFTASIITVMLLMIAIPSPTETEAAVWWDGVELKKGQIGRLFILQDTPLYKLNGDRKSFSRTLKAGENYRIYAFKPGKLSVGGGYYVDRDARIKYETPSKLKLQAANGVKVVEKVYEGVLPYPQVTGLVSSTAEAKINEKLLAHVKTSYNGYLQVEQDEIDHKNDYYNYYGYPVTEDEKWMYEYTYDLRYKIKYNENNQLSILLYDYLYLGGAHGMTGVTSYNFDSSSGNQVTIGDVAPNWNARMKMKDYAIVDLLNQHNREKVYVWEDELYDITIDNDRPFYYTSNGVTVIFGEYEIAPYAYGMPESKIPYSVFR